MKRPVTTLPISVALVAILLASFIQPAHAEWKPGKPGNVGGIQFPTFPISPPIASSRMMPVSPEFHSSSAYDLHYFYFLFGDLLDFFAGLLDEFDDWLDGFDAALKSSTTEEEFAAAGGGIGSAVYEWYFQQELGVGPLTLLSTTGSTLAINDLQLVHSGFYKAHRLESGLVWIYDFVELKVLNAPIISEQPAERHLVAGETLELSIAADGGTPPYTYQWYRDTGNGYAQVGTGQNLSMPAMDSTGQGMYKCVVVDSAIPEALTARG